MPEKILMINCLDFNYGSTHRIRRFYEFLKNEYDVKYIESNYKNNDKNTISINQSMTPLGFLWGTIKRIYYTVILDYDILFFQKFSPFTVPCSIVSKLKNKLVIVDCDDLDSDFQKNKFRKVITAFFEKIGPRFVDCIITHNDYLRDHLRNSGVKVPIFLVFQGVDTELFNPEKYDRERLRKEKSLEDRIVLVYLTGFGTGGTMDLDIIMKGVTLARERAKDIYFILIGGGPMWKQYREEFSGSNIEFTGYLNQEEVAKYICLSDIGMIYLRDNPGNRSRVSLKVLEYLSMKKPVVGHLVGLTKDLWGDFCVLSGDSAKDFSEKLIYSIEHRANLPDARKIIEDKYDWNKIKDSFLDVISIYGNR